MKKVLFVLSTLSMSLIFAQESTEEYNGYPNLNNQSQQQVGRWFTDSTAENNLENLKTALKENILDINATYENDNTLLHYAALQGNPNKLKIIAGFSHKATMQKKNNENKTPLDIVTQQIVELNEPFEQNKFKDLTKCVKILKNNGAKGSFVFSEFKVNKVDIFEFCLKHGIITYDQKGEDGNTILHQYAMAPVNNAIEPLRLVPPSAFLIKNSSNQTPLDIVNQTMKTLTKKEKKEDNFHKYEKGFLFIKQQTEKAEREKNSSDDCCIIV